MWCASRTLRVVVPFWTVISVTTAPIVPVTIFFLTIDRTADAGYVGLILSAYGLGSVGGALIATRFSHGRLGRMMLVANVASAVGILGFAFSAVALVQAGFAMFAGAAGALVFVPYITLRSTIPPNHLLGRVGSSARPPSPSPATRSRRCASCTWSRASRAGSRSASATSWTA